MSIDGEDDDRLHEDHVLHDRPSIPTSWTWATPAQLAVREDYALAIGPFGSNLRVNDYTAEGVPLVFVRNIRTGDFDGKAAKFVSEEKAAELQAHVVRPGDILITKMGDPPGDACLYPPNKPPAVITADCIKFTPETNQALAKFLVFAIQSQVVRNQIKHITRGVAQQKVSLGRFSSIVLPIAPVAEQRRIVAELETQFARIDAAENSLKLASARLRQYRATVLRAACEGRLVPTEAELARAEGRDYEPADRLLDRLARQRMEQWEVKQQSKTKVRGRTLFGDEWRKRYPSPAPPVIIPETALPGGWNWVTMPQMGEVNRGKSRHRPRNDPRLLNGPYPFVQTGDVRSSNGFIRSHIRTYSEFGLAQSRLWPAGTLCITIAANIAETGILSYPACFPDSVVGFVCDNHPEVVRFVACFIECVRQRLEQYAPATAQKNINLEILTELAIPLPPHAELIRIVAEVERRLSLIDELEAVVSANLKRAGRLRQSILKRAFEGKLVPQDPADEPASALLERIARARGEESGLLPGIEPGKMKKTRRR